MYFIILISNGVKMFIVCANMNFGVILLEKYLQKIYTSKKHVLYTIAYPCVKTRQFILHKHFHVHTTYAKS